MRRTITLGLMVLFLAAVAFVPLALALNGNGAKLLPQRTTAADNGNGATSAVDNNGQFGRQSFMFPGRAEYCKDNHGKPDICKHKHKKCKDNNGNHNNGNHNCKHKHKKHKGNNGNCRCRDIDHDGKPNNHDRDMDGDGKPNNHDQDCDGDGILNVNDTTPRGIGS